MILNTDWPRPCLRKMLHGRILWRASCRLVWCGSTHLTIPTMGFLLEGINHPELVANWANTLWMHTRSRKQYMSTSALFCECPQLLCFMALRTAIRCLGGHKCLA